MKKNLTKRIIVILAVLLVLATTVAVIIFATGAAQSADGASLAIEATNLSFSDSVYIKYGVARNGVSAEDVTLLVWTEPQSEYVKGTESAVLTHVGSEKIDGVDCLIFNFTGLAANQMTDVVYARAYAKIGSTEIYSAPKKYSILQYAYNKMGKTGTKTENAELITLLEDMLGYGALAQKYTNYKTDTLATDSFSQIKLGGGSLSDGFNHGLYKVGSTVTITAPATDDGFNFVGWRNAAGKIVSTNTTATVEVGESNELYRAVYQGATSDKLEYTANEDGITYTVSGIGECTDTSLVIPSVVNGKLVTAIGEGAFKDCTGIKSVTISKEITSIGAEAFSGCTGVTSIYYAGSENAWGKIAKGTDWNLGMPKYSLYFGENEENWELGAVPLK